MKLTNSSYWKDLIGEFPALYFSTTCSAIENNPCYCHWYERYWFIKSVSYWLWNRYVPWNGPIFSVFCLLQLWSWNFFLFALDGSGKEPVREVVSLAEARCTYMWNEWTYVVTLSIYAFALRRRGTILRRVASTYVTIKVLLKYYRVFKV